MRIDPRVEAETCRLHAEQVAGKAEAALLLRVAELFEALAGDTSEFSRGPACNIQVPS